jgi:hypothetical protein
MLRNILEQILSIYPNSSSDEFEKIRQSNAAISHMQWAAYAQKYSLRHPKSEFSLHRSFFDIDGIASDAVEGRNNELEFYRKRGDA